MNAGIQLRGGLAAAWAIALALLMSVPATGHSQEAQWIWSPKHQVGEVPQTSCYFRRSFVVDLPETGQIELAADDDFELYVNGRTAAKGSSSRTLKQIDISKHLTKGRNVISMKVVNSKGPTGALAARVFVKEKNGGWKNYHTNDGWKVTLSPYPFWNMNFYNDSRWDKPQFSGKLGTTDKREEVKVVEEVVKETTDERFRINPEFRVERIISDEQAGSLISMTFNEFGQILAGRENGPLLLIADTNNDEIADRVTVYCDKVKNCQGIMALNGEVYVTADGPDGSALYRLADHDGDSKLESVRTLLKFKGDSAEHGPHGIVLGPDGYIYVVVGNHARVEKAFDPRSPHRDHYEGDLVKRYEDPGGHAAGVKSPGGTIIRTNTEGGFVQLFAGGLRNVYDIAFNANGDLFAHDSDMESDMGANWYRPTQVYHVTPGAELGWRSGWSKWPSYYSDAIPAVEETGRGSPTGGVFYNHFAFPARYHNALFLADWSEGRIIAVRMKRKGGSYTTTSETFLQGQPLNVTDLEVGPDGGLYFITGGRGTSGGVYRVSWRGEIPENVKNLGDGLNAVIRQPQAFSAWGRQKVASLKSTLGADWGENLAGVARSSANPEWYRTRALDLMQLFGPAPSEQLLIELAKEKNENVRAKAATLMGIHSSDATRLQLIELLYDEDRTVRRVACEALVRAGQDATLTRLTRALVSDDRHEAYSARRLLERMPLESWKDRVMKTSDQRLFIQGAMALMIAHPSRAHGLQVLKRTSQMLDGFVSDKNFIDLLRVTQIAILRGKLAPADAPILREQLAEEFPSGSSHMNRELVRLLAFLQATSPMERYMDYLASDVPEVDKLHLALHLSFIKSGWTTKDRMRVLEYLSAARNRKGGGSYPFYVASAMTDFARNFPAEDVPQLLAGGARWPDAALGLLYKLPKEINDETRRRLIQLDQSLDTPMEGQEESVKKLRIGIVAVLARSADEPSMAYLRTAWERDPERRKAIALGLSQKPGGENWVYLVRSIPETSGDIARDLLKSLLAVRRRPASPDPLRQVILKGLELKENGAVDAVKLLEHWTGEQRSGPEDPWADAIVSWQHWYNRKYPNGLTPNLPVASSGNKWKFDELLEYLDSDEARNSVPQHGAAVFTKAQCAKCHRYGETGQSLGPDLTNLHKRFTRREVLESIIYPSHVISDQYASKTIVTEEGAQLTGLVTPGPGESVIVVDSNGKKTVVQQDEIEEVVASKVSAMPAGLLNDLSLAEIASLFSYLRALQPSRVARSPQR